MLQNAYVLRFWRATQHDVWRVTLIPINEETTEQHFGSLEEAYRHLQGSYINPIEAESTLRRYMENHEDREE